MQRLRILLFVVAVGALDVCDKCEHGKCEQIETVTGPLEFCECDAPYLGLNCTGLAVDCPPGCADHGSCASAAAEGGNYSYCACDAAYFGDACTLQSGGIDKPKEVSSDDISWMPSFWGVVGVALGLCCLERLYASCKRVYRRRQGKPTEGFAQLPMTTSSRLDVEEADRLDAEAAQPNINEPSDFAIELDPEESKDDESSESDF